MDAAEAQDEIRRLLSEAQRNKDAANAAHRELEQQLSGIRLELQGSEPLKAISEYTTRALHHVQLGTNIAQQLAEATFRAGRKQQEQLDQAQQQLQEIEARIDKERQYQQQVLGTPCVPLRVGDTVQHVGISTLLTQAPGSYFNGMLRMYGVDGVSDAREQLEDAIKRQGGALPVDEDPDALKCIINYLRYASNPTMLGKDPKTLLLPSSEPLRSMVLAAAERLGLEQCCGRLAPPGDIVNQLTHEDAEMRAVEEGYREAFVSQPSSMLEAWRQGKLLLDVFSPDTLPTFMYEGPSPYPELFSHLDYPTASLPNGTRSVVEDLDTFKRHFKHFTDGLFEGFDWSNMIVAGGAVMACLLRPPHSASRETKEFPWPNHSSQFPDPAWRSLEVPWGTVDWLGPNTLRSGDAAGRNALGDPDERWVQHLGFDDRVVASSGFGDSDIDVFFYGLSPTEATAKLEALGAHLKSKALLESRLYGEPQGKASILAVRSEHAVTFATETATPTTRPSTHVQVILRVYSSPAEVLMGFDIDSCCVAYDGERVRALPRSRRAINRRHNVVDPGRLSPSYESRLAKYARRGFKVAVPGFPGQGSVNSSIYLKPYEELEGLSRLLRQEQSSALDRRPRCGLILQPTTLLKSRRKWLKTYKSNVPTSTEAAINSRVEQPARDPAAAAESDYSSAFIPKGMFAEDLHHFLAHNCRKTQGSGIPSKLVWSWGWPPGPSSAGADPNEPNYVLHTAPLLIKYPNLTLELPQEVEWMTENPGQQGRLTGSFHPLEGTDWTQQAYARDAA